MKKLTLILAFIFGISISNSFANYPMSIGPYFQWKAGVNAADVPDGTKNALGFANMPDFGAVFYLPFQPDSKTGLLVNVGYHTYPYGLKTGVGGTNEFTSDLNYSYVILGGAFHVSGFTVGFDLGFPSSASSTTKGTTYDVTTNGIGMLVDLRLGANFPLVESETGRLCLQISAGYSVTNQFDNNSTYFNKEYNYHPASAALGLSYFFNLTPPVTVIDEN